MNHHPSVSTSLGCHHLRIVWCLACLACLHNLVGHKCDRQWILKRQPLHSSRLRKMNPRTITGLPSAAANAPRIRHNLGVPPKKRGVETKRRRLVHSFAGADHCLFPLKSAADTYFQQGSQESMVVAIPGFVSVLQSIILFTAKCKTMGEYEAKSAAGRMGSMSMLIIGELRTQRR